MAERRYHAIFQAFFSVDDFSTETEIPKPYANLNGVQFEDIPDDHPKDPLGNNYGAPDFRIYTFAFLHRSTYTTMKTNQDADTSMSFKFVLDNGEIHQTNVPILPLQLKPVDIEGTVGGRSNAFMFQVRVDKARVDEITT